MGVTTRVELETLTEEAAPAVLPRPMAASGNTRLHSAAQIHRLIILGVCMSLVLAQVSTLAHLLGELAGSLPCPSLTEQDLLSCVPSP